MNSDTMLCPKCGKKTRGVKVIKPRASTAHVGFVCPHCHSAYIQNPGVKIDTNSPEMKRGLKLYEEFNFKKPDKITTMKISMPGPHNPLVKLAEITGIVYRSDKANGNANQQFIHETEKPYPGFYATADGKTFIITGGKMIVKDGWLYY